MDKKKRLNSTYLGILLGTVVPAITVYIYYFYKFKTLTFVNFLKRLDAVGIASAIVSLCALPNLLVFFIFIWINYLYSARGVVFATMLYAALVVFLKYVI